MAYRPLVLLASGLSLWVFASPVSAAGEWAAITWDGAPSVVNGIVSLDPDGDGPQKAIVFVATDNGVYYVNEQGVLAQALPPHVGQRVATIGTRDPDGDGPLPSRLIVGIQPGAFAPTTLVEWDLSDFDDPSTTILGTFDEDVRSVRSYDVDGDGDDELVAVGSFSSIDHNGLVLASRTAVLDEGAWSQLGTPPNSTCNALESVSCEQGASAFACDGGSALLLGGFFDQAGGQTCTMVARWDRAEQDWRPCAEGLPNGGAVRAIATVPSDARADGTDLVCGGTLIAQGGAALNGIGRYDGEAWNAFDFGLFGFVSSLVTFDVDGEGPQGAVLVAGGSMPTTTQGQPINRVGYFDGDGWQPLGGGIDAIGANVNSLVPFDFDGDGPEPVSLIVAGSFGGALLGGPGGIPADHIGVWRTATAVGPCNEADLAVEFGVLDLSDIALFVSAFTANQAFADLDGNGVWDLADITIFVLAFLDGCP